MNKWAVAGLAGLAVATMAVPAKAQRIQWKVIPCDESWVAISQFLTCAILPTSRTFSADSSAVAATYMTRGWSAGNNIYLVLAMPVAESFIIPYGNARAMKRIKDFALDTQSGASEWSELHATDQTASMAFRADNKDCVGFDHVGPLKERGYAWTLYGYICSSASIAAPSEFLKTLLAAVRVGPPDTNQNALGTQVARFSAPQ